MPAKSSSRLATLLMAAVVSASGLGGLAYYVGSTPDARRVPIDEKRPDLVAKTDTPDRDAHSTEVRNGALTDRKGTVGQRHPSPSASSSPLQKSTELDAPKMAKLVGGKVTLVPAPPSQGDKMVAALDATFAAMSFKAARVLSTEVKNDLLILNLNAAATSGVGSMQEAELVEGLRRVAGQVKTVKYLSLQVEGQAIDSFGHFELPERLTVLRPGQKVDEEPTGEELPRP